MLSHFKALFIKHLIIAKRNPFFTFLEFIAPILAVLLINWIRTLIDPVDQGVTSQQNNPQFSQTFSGSHQTQDPMPLTTQLNSVTDDGLSCTNSGSSYYQHLNQAKYLTSHNNQATAGAFASSQSLNFSKIVDYNTLYPGPLGTCHSSEFYVDTTSPTEDEVINISQNNKYNFDIFHMPECFKSEFVQENGQTVVNTYPTGLIGIIGKFDGTDEQAFLDAFKTAFTTQAVPLEFSSNVRYQNTEKAALDAAYRMDPTKAQEESFCLMLNFKDVQITNASPKVFDYEIKIRQNIISPTFDFRERRPFGTDWNEYITTGQASVQTFIDEFILETILDPSDFKKLSYTFAPLTSRPYRDDILLSLSIGLLFFLLGIAYCPTVVSIVSTLTKDKEFKQREGMAMMGMSTLTYYLSFQAQRIIIAFFQAIIMSQQMHEAIYTNSNYFAILLVFMQLAMSTMSISFMLSALFDSSRNGAIMGTLVQFGSVFIIILYDQFVNPSWKVILGCFFPVMYIFFASAGVANLEISTTGFQFDRLTANINGYTMGDCIFGSFLAFVVHNLLIVYLEYAVPSEYGSSQGWFFPFSSEFWMNEVFVTEHSELAPKNENEKQYNIEEESDEKKQANQEELSEKHKAMDKTGTVLKVDAVRKVFGDLVAVNNIHMKMQEGEIFALLGHNGAGKTTTISMLTGLLMPDSGEGSFHGVDLFRQMKKIRTALGVCPQLDVLFDDMTVREHLEMQQTYKDPHKNFLIEDASEYDQYTEVEKWLDKFYLREFEHDQAQNLSGGTKRRLSVAIAVIGGSKLILLDEPSSGMDLTSKYKLWDILKEIRKGRVIILTTHYMDEADYLGDRIAIMGEGKIRCCGGNLYLKEKFGGGQKLQVEFERNIGQLLEEMISNLSSIVQLKIVEKQDNRIDLKIPKNESSKFGRMFEFLEYNKEKYSIATQGFGDSNLEDVFLAVSELNEHHNADNDIEFAVETETVTGCTKMMQHFQALIIKRYRQQTRDIFGIACEILLPIICVILGLWIRQYFATFSQDQSPINFHPDNLFGQEVNGLPTFMASKLNYFTFDYNGSGMSTGSIVDITVSDSILNKYANYDQNIINRVSDSGITLEQQNQALEIASKVDTRMYEEFEKKFESQEEPLFGISMQNSVDSQSFFVNQNSRQNHGVPMVLNWTANSVLAKFNADTTITHSFNPIPYTDAEKNATASFSLLWFSFFCIIGLSLVPASSIVFIVKERESLSKMQQQVSGVSILSQWMSNFIWDMFKFMITSLAIILVFWLFNFDSLFIIKDYQLYAFLLSQLTFGFSIFGFTYLTSQMQNTLLRAMVSTMTFFLATGIIGYIANSILSVLAIIDNDTQGKWDTLVDVTLAVCNPIYSFVRVITEVSLIEGANRFEFSQDAFDQDKVFKYHIYQIQTGVASFVLIFIIEILNSNLGAFHSKPEHLKTVNSVPGEISAMKVDKLFKSYKDWTGTEKNAVNGISFQANTNSCQVILGTNGAGKSSLFKCMTGEVAPTSGEVTIANHSVMHDMDEARQAIGQCPQANSIIDNLNAAETIMFYGRLKYLNQASLDSSVNLLLDMMNLRMNKDNLAGRFSGGNKRKLMVACSLIGNPKAILLDEPSTGMDPEAKRFMWNSIKKFKNNSGVVLTTHSMDEAEALADYLAIQKSGEFKFTGTLSQLRKTQSKGLQVDMMLKISNEQIDELKTRISCSEEVLNLKQVRKQVSAAFDGKQTWEDISNFGNGHIIHEQIYLKEAHIESESASIDAGLFLEFIAVITQIRKLAAFMLQSFPGCTIDMENIGQLVRFNIVAEGMTCGALFSILDVHKDELMINYQSIANSKMETILRSFIEDDAQNSKNSCNQLIKNDNNNQEVFD